MRYKGMLIPLLAALLLVAAPAVAKKGGGKGPPDGPTGGYTCSGEEFTAREAFSGVIADDSYGDGVADFTVTLDRSTDSVCIDVIAPAGKWLVNVTGSGARGLTLVPRDSFSPGDSCGGASLSAKSVYGNLTLPLPIDSREEIPAATVNACGVVYGEWIAGELVIEQTGVEHPLVFQAFLTGGGKASTTISVDLPAEQP